MTTMALIGAGIAFLAVLGASLAGCAAAVKLLGRRAILDHPNERSSHSHPTPRGGGIALLGVLLPAWAAVAILHPEGTSAVWAPLAGALFLGAVSWIDDLGGLGVGIRLAVQLAAVALGMAALAGSGPVFQGLLPPLADRIAAAILWLWFVNLFNFMDGIDGIAGGETAALGGGVFIVIAATGWAAPVLGLFGLSLCAAALGFLWWNWQPARIFLGDVGSVPLGYLLGWLLLAMAANGLWAAALILPLYYLADATLTLARRLVRGEAPWRAHAEHFYQRAVRRGLSHGGAVRAIAGGNLVLLALALVAALDRANIVYALAAAAATVAILLFYLANPRPGGS